MAEFLEAYRCEVCGNIVVVFHAGKGGLSCCGQPMVKLDESSRSGAEEKHRPVVEKKEDGYLVKVGSAPHAMDESHYIEWIELRTDAKELYVKFLSPGDAPEAFFKTEAKEVKAREYCNLHGLWES